MLSVRIRRHNPYKGLTAPVIVPRPPHPALSPWGEGKGEGFDISGPVLCDSLKLAHECHEVPLLLLAESELKNQIEKFHRVIQRKKSPIV